MRSGDVVVVGGGLGGMLAAAMLGRAGRSVTLFEREPHLGGRLRSFDFAGGFVVDEGAYLWPDAHVSRALEKAGATEFIRSVIPRDRVLRLFAEGEGGRRLAFPFPQRQATAKVLESARVALGVDAEEYAALCRLWHRWSELSDAQVDELRHVPLREGLARFGVGGPLGAVVRRNVMLFGTYDPDSASTAECIELGRRRFDRSAAEPVAAGANRAGGVRALAAALVTALGRAGVAVRLATPVVGVDIAGGRVRSVRAAESGGSVQTIAVESVVMNVPIAAAIDLFGPDAFPAEFTAEARAWSAVGGVIAAAYAFRGLPCLRDGGAEDEFPGWTRLLSGPDRSFGGGMLWATRHSPRNAPSGCHVLQVMRLSPRGDIEDPVRVAAVHAGFDRILREIYLDTAEKLLWSRQWTTGDGSEYMVSAARRPAVQAPGVGGLYFVGETTDVPAVQMDAAALSALRCVDLIAPD